MRIRAVACILFAVFIAQATVAPGGQVDVKLATKLYEVLKDRKADWIPTAVVESSHIPVVPSEKVAFSAYWHPKAPDKIRDGVNISVYKVENTAEAQKWIQITASGRMAEGCTRKSYPLADQSYLDECRNEHWYQIAFRKGPYVGRMSGNTLPDIEACAKLIVSELPKN